MSLVELETKVDNHLTEYDKRCKRQDEAYDKTMEAINKLTESTQGIVEAWTAANSFQRFIKWVSSFAVVGAVITWFYTNLPNFFK